MVSCEIAFGTPRKLPSAGRLGGLVVVVDIAFAGAGSGGGFEGVTLPLITKLGERLRAWVDHHDHEQHSAYKGDPRFVLATKAEHPACPEMVTPELVERVGRIDTILCHTDFDGLASAAKWMLGGQEPYPGCDLDARAIDTRTGHPSKVGERFDRAIRGRPRDLGLLGVIVRHLASGLRDKSLWSLVDDAAAELIPIERSTRRIGERYRVVPPGVAMVMIGPGEGTVDKTLLLLLGQERAPVSVVVDRDTVSVAAAFESGINFLTLFGLPGGMPTRVSLPRSQLRRVLSQLGVAIADMELLGS